MLNVKFDTTQFSKSMKNIMAYSFGFFDGIQSNKLKFNRYLGEYTKEILEDYIDAQARANPESLHHVYEPGMVGRKNGRLFKLEVSATQNNIIFNGSFLPSSGTPLNGGQPFVNKAEIMENDISIVIEPRSSKVLVFEYEGDLVFTPNAVYIDHPGGDEVAGSFGKTVDKFFFSFFTNAMLMPMINNLKTADEFTKNFANSAKGGRQAGFLAGKKYLDNVGVLR